MTTRRGFVSWNTPIEDDRSCPSNPDGPHERAEGVCRYCGDDAGGRASDEYDPAHIAELAELAFWAVVAAKVPEATTGDLEPLVAHEFRTACERAIRVWINSNAPEPED